MTPHTWERDGYYEVDACPRCGVYRFREGVRLDRCFRSKPLGSEVASDDCDAELLRKVLES